MVNRRRGSVRTWAYNGKLPSNEIRIRKGVRMRATVTNKFLINGRVPADPDMRDYAAGQRIRIVSEVSHCPTPPCGLTY
jgi:hypothetical protein